MFSNIYVLEEKIHSHINRYMPVRTVSVYVVTLSALDDTTIIRTKSRVSCLSKDKLCFINKRIADIISENRRKFNSKKSKHNLCKE